MKKPRRYIHNTGKPRERSYEGSDDERDMASDDDWNDNWNPDKIKTPESQNECYDSPEETTPTSESILFPLRELHPRDVPPPEDPRIQFAENLRKRLEKEGRRPFSLQKILDKLLRRQIDFDLGKEHCYQESEENKEYRHHVESRSITQFYYSLKDYIAFIEKEYHDNIWKVEKELPGWMMKDEVIANLMKKTRLADVLKALRKHSTEVLNSSS